MQPYSRYSASKIAKNTRSSALSAAEARHSANGARLFAHGAAFCVHSHTSVQAASSADTLMTAGSASAARTAAPPPARPRRRATARAQSPAPLRCRTARAPPDGAAPPQAAARATAPRRARSFRPVRAARAAARSARARSLPPPHAGRSVRLPPRRTETSSTGTQTTACARGHQKNREYAFCSYVSPFRKP